MSVILNFASENTLDKNNNYFPVFMMGNSMRNLAHAISDTDTLPVSNMYDLKNKNLKLRLNKQLQNTMLFDELAWLEYEDDDLYQLL